MKYLLAVCFFFLGCITMKCTMFEKNNDSNEINSLTQDVLKKGEGIDIQVKPIPVGKNG